MYFLVLTNCLLTLMCFISCYLIGREVYKLKQGSDVTIPRKGTGGPEVNISYKEHPINDGVDLLGGKEFSCLIFVSKGCPACDSLNPQKIGNLQMNWKPKFNFMKFDSFSSADDRLTDSIFRAFKITVTPQVVILDSQLTVIDSALVNGATQLNNMLKSVDKKHTYA